MAIYRKGTASLSTENIMTGTDTKWLENLALIRVGATVIFFNSGNMKMGTISSIVSDTEIRLNSTDGEAVPDGEYAILLHDGLTVEGLAQDIAETLRYWQSQTSDIDSRIEAIDDAKINKGDAALVANNLSDLKNQSAALANLIKARTAKTVRADLELGGSALLEVGKASGTVAAGDDSRIVGAMQSANNLSDVADKAVSRKNLELSATDYVTFAGMELLSSSPYIDFRYGNTSNDYSVRMINPADKVLELSALTGNVSFRVNGGIRCGGANYAGGMNIYQGNGNDSSLYGISVSSGNLSIAAGASTNSRIEFNSNKLGNFSGLQGRSGLSGTAQGNYYNFYWDSALRLQAYVDSSSVGYVTLTTNSDRQLKKDIVYLDENEETLAELMQWKPVRYKYRARGLYPDSDDKLGVIANDLIQVSPECVDGVGLKEDYDIVNDPNNGDAYYLDNMAIMTKMFMSIQALTVRVDELKARVAELEGK